MALFVSRSVLAVRTSRAALALRLSEPKRGVPGYAWSSVSGRRKYPMFAYFAPDPLIGDWMFAKFVRQWYADPSYYPYWGLAWFAIFGSFAYMVRLNWFDPHIYNRQGQVSKLEPDRYRQWTYSLPYYNHHFRNVCARHRWCMIDNEPDYADAAHPWGIRPARHQSPIRHFWAFTVPKYRVDDPLYEHCTHEEVERRYREMGYYKCREEGEGEGDE